MPASKPQALASFHRNGKKRATSRFSFAPAGVSPPLPIAALFDLRSMQAARPEAKRRAGGRSGFAGGFRFFRHASRVSSKSHAPGAGQSAAKAIAVGCGCRPLRVVQPGANADCWECSGGSAMLCKRSPSRRSAAPGNADRYGVGCRSSLSAQKATCCGCSLLPCTSGRKHMLHKRSPSGLECSAGQVLSFI